MGSFDDKIRNIRALAEGRQPDMDISELLYKHGCFYLLSMIDGGNGYAQRLQAEQTLNRVCVNERYAACSPVFDMLRQNEMPYAVIKGAALSRAAYGDIYARKSGDIDILIRRRDIDEVKKFMLEKGFVQGRVTEEGLVPFSRRELIFQTGLSHQAAPFILKRNNPLCPYVNVDVNMDILWGESGRQTDMDFVLSETENAVIAGVNVRKLSPAMEFAALCLHHYKDMNSIYLLAGGSLKLSLFCDVYFYLKNSRPDSRELKNICETLKITEYVYYCVYYANLIFACDALNGYLAALEHGKNEELLNAFGLDDKERRLWQIPFEERLFREDFAAVFTGLLSEKDKEKIRLNSASFL